MEKCSTRNRQILSYNNDQNYRNGNNGRFLVRQYKYWQSEKQFFFIIGNDIIVSLRRSKIDFLNHVNLVVPKMINDFDDNVEVNIPMITAIVIKYCAQNIDKNSYLEYKFL